MAEMELAKVESDALAQHQAVTAPAAEVGQPWMTRIEEHASWPLLSQMTVSATAGVPLEGFKIGDLLRLEPGQIVESLWPHTEDIPLKAGRVQLAWSEFEVVEQRLMVRLTRLA